MDQYRNEATALATESGARFRVDIGDVDAETFREAASFNEGVRGMAGAAVRNDDGELLFIDHEDYGGWVFPGGVVEANETFPEAAVREVREESGVVARVVRPLLVIHFVPRYDGRSIDNFFVLFEGEAVDAEPCEDPGLDDECITDVRWTSTVPDRLPDDSTVRRTVQCATAEFETVSRA